MIKIDSKKEFRLVSHSFSVVKKINLKEIGFNQISSSNLYIYQSDEYKILNYSIKPELIFLIKSEEDNIQVKLQNINIKNLPNIFKRLELNVNIKILPEKDFCKLIRYISLRYESKNKLITYVSETFINKILNNLIETYQHVLIES